jgi:hypothetical protein
MVHALVRARPLLAKLRDGEATADLVGESVGNLTVARHCFHFPSLRIEPEGVGPTFTLEMAAMAP